MVKRMGNTSAFFCAVAVGYVKEFSTLQPMRGLVLVCKQDNIIGNSRKINFGRHLFGLHVVLYTALIIWTQVFVNNIFYSKILGLSAHPTSEYFF